MTPFNDNNQVLVERLDRIEEKLDLLVKKRAVKDWYSTAEFAQIVCLSRYTVRQHCLHGRLHAKKRACGRGPTQEWMISHEELLRYQNHGLLPAPRTSTKF